LLKDEGIVRHRGKIEATINNAKRAIELEMSEGSLAAYFWRHEPKPDEHGRPQTRLSPSTARPRRRGWWRRWRVRSLSCPRHKRRP
jgi:DNA-3-methyladenine glycosylase I